MSSFLSHRRKAFAGGAGGEPLNANLVSFWKLQEASGTRVDEAASGNDLDDINTVTGSIDSIVYTDSSSFAAGTYERLRITDATQTGLGVTGSFTLCGWFNFTLLTSTRGLFSKYDGTTQRAWSAFYRSSQSDIRFILSGDGANVTACDASFSPSLNTWYHLCIRYDSAATEMAVIIDGGTPSTATFSGSVFDATADFSLGYTGFSPTSVGSYHNGLIEACGFWDRALTNAEVTRLADETDSFYAQY